MCGIVGYVGNKEAVGILIEGLKRLEYRGYDSSGIGVISSDDGSIELRKTQGKIQNLLELIKGRPLKKSQLGISHTRWATHGEPNRVNAHPHSDCKKQILVVHNGIIENYQALKDKLKSRGHTFVSQTDTEVVAHLIEECDKGDFLEAVRLTIKQLKGSFALGVISRRYPGMLVAARIGSPLIIGVGKNENFIASDVPAILDRTKRVIYLQDGQIAALESGRIKIVDFQGKKIKPKVDIVSFKIGSAEKQGFDHFMLKEIHEQPKVLEQMLSTRIRGNRINLDGIRLNEKQIKKISKVIVVACGTAYHAGMVGKYIIEQLAGVPVETDLSSEFRYRHPIVDSKTLIIAISQSGETADTLAAVKEAKLKGAKVISICNVVGSSLVRESDGVLYTHAGPEIGVASTKAYTAQLCMLYLLAVKLGEIKNTLSSAIRAKVIKNLRHVPHLLTDILKAKSAVAKVARAHSHFGCFLFLGRNINYPSALEGALKLKEISYIPAEGYAAGEMKHGPIALIDEYRAVVCIVPESDIYEKMISNIQEIRSRKGRIIAIATSGDKEITRHVHEVIYIPSAYKLLTPLLAALPLQLLAYYISVKRGCDVDQPRNLAKSVTVE
ncbi:MAG TPA: glutamine--fructose-6-phosphate transaminase (isomerizing) [Candidatus Omnitrophota bacterium]|nr:glutamine--fructose-6-phosphate transaminase (isomerizing) [Candidatus Omnitrophota bacterium]HPD84503.1 glutamine--fructose-6-phosphate transaminase (isomerizing) [Candidatus Omnitrophota bacterium]HRZ03361.1 glutamine--fructose-6-phosphate transaminase (isomerizing) [Candidatus Omnitrophota bacterium]